MMNLEEVLKGIGQQMSRGTPSWSDPDPGFSRQSSFNGDPGFSMPPAGLVPQLQNPDPGFSMGPWSKAAMGGSWADGLMNKSSTGSSWGDSLSGSARGHIDAAGQMRNATKYQKGTPASNNDEVDQYIRQAFSSRGHDPDIASRVYHSEGANAYAGDNNSSFGPFQLHYGGVASGGNAVGGLGDQFTRDTGLDARDPSTWQAQVNWIADHLGSTGWDPWHGAAAQGITGKMGVGTGSSVSTNTTSSTSSGNGSIMEKAKPFLGRAYVWGGKSPDTGFDCSGLAGYLTTGKAESTRTLYAKTTAINEQDAQPGDLVFYHMGASAGPSDEHVAVYDGNGQIVQSGGTQNNVNVASAHQFTEPGWQPEYRRLSGR